ncbi:MAG: dual specificity protein phosphatase [Cyanobacteriota bacterium]|nr:dual specificity protein phosphatase [Cyanobacteriota bacterium]
MVRKLFARLMGRWISPRTQIDRPNSTSLSWVIPGKLAVGGLPNSGTIAQLTQARIATVLALCSESEGQMLPEIQASFQTWRYVLPDRHYREKLTPAQLAAAVEIIHQSLQNQQPIYVHCFAGIERSPTVCVAYLCRYGQQNLWDALEWVKSVHPSTCPTTDQLRVLEEFTGALPRTRKGDSL